MGIGSFFGRLFGAAAAEPGEPVEYKGYLIYPAPKAKGGEFNVAGIIAKEFPDGEKRHSFIRADTCSSRDQAIKDSIHKAQLIIDQLGDRLFASGP